MLDRRQDSPDHDLLIKLNEKVDNLTEKLNELTDHTRAQVEDHETRLRWVERISYFGLAIIAIAEFVLRFFPINKL